MRTTLIALAAFLISATAVNAQLAPPDANRAARLAAITKWTIMEGYDKSLLKGLAQEFGFGDSDPPAMFHAYGDNNTEAKIFYVLE